MSTLAAEPDEHNGNAGKHDGVEVVFFEPAVTRFVVGLVPAPAPAMHDVFVRPVGEAFHQGKSRQEYQGVDKHRGEVLGGGNSMTVVECWMFDVKACDGRQRSLPSDPRGHCSVR
jgi:hypothetical protein